MTDLPFLVARIDGDGGPDRAADQEYVPWWSLTKTAIAVAALQLVRQGHCRLDEALDGQPFTLRQLLQHRAGVPNYGSLAAYHEAVRRGEAPWTISELLTRVGADHLDFEPGNGWNYSNIGYLYVRQLIERITGRDLNDALRFLVFDDLSLASVRVAARASDLVDTAWGNATGYDPNWAYHGLLIGTAGDAARFFHGLMSGHVLPAGLLAEMTLRHPIGEGPLPDRPWLTTGYGLGLMMGQMASAGLAVGHSGGGPGSVGAAYFFADRPNRCTVAAFVSGLGEGRAEFEALRLAL